MSIKAHCPSCGKRYQVKPKLAGKRFRCKECGSPVRVPQRMSAPAIDDEFDYEGYEDYENGDFGDFDLRRRTVRPGRRKKKKLHRGLVLSAIGGTAVLVVGIGIWAVLSLTGYNVPADARDISPDFWNVQVDPPAEPPPAPPPEPPLISLAGMEDLYFLDETDRWCVIKRETNDPDVFSHELVDLYTGERRGSTTTLSRCEEVLTISRNGKYAAGITLRSMDGNLGDDREVLVYNFVDGRMTSYTLGEMQSFETAKLLPGERLLIGTITMIEESPGVRIGDGPGTVTIHDLRTPDVSHSFQTENGAIDSGVVSRGGRYFVFTTHTGYTLDVHEVETGELVGRTHLPRPQSRRDDGLNCTHLSFSHDGTRLAGIFSGTISSRVLCWDWATGEGLADVRKRWVYEMDERMNSSSVHTLTWLRDDSAWIFNHRFLVDPETGTELLGYALADTDRNEKFYRVSSDAMVRVSRSDGQSPEQLTFVPIDRDFVDTMLKATRSADAAHVSAHQKVSVDVEIQKLRHGDKESTRRFLAEAAGRKLDALGFNVAENQPVTLKIVYSESKGEVLVETKSDRAFLPEPLPGGKRVTGTRADVVVMWMVNGMDEPVWKEGFEVEPPFVRLSREISDAAARAETLRDTERELKRLTIPYYVPKDPSLPTLPHRVDLLPDEAG